MLPPGMDARTRRNVTSAVTTLSVTSTRNKASVTPEARFIIDRDTRSCAVRQADDENDPSVFPLWATLSFLWAFLGPDGRAYARVSTTTIGCPCHSLRQTNSYERRRHPGRTLHKRCVAHSRPEDDAAWRIWGRAIKEFTAVATQTEPAAQHIEPGGSALERCDVKSAPQPDPASAA